MSDAGSENAYDGYEHDGGYLHGTTAGKRYLTVLFMAAWNAEKLRR